MMTFNSIEEAIAYIEGAVSKAMPMMGDEIELIMQEAITSDIYSDHGNTTGTRTGQLLESPKMTHTYADGVEVEYLDNGDWESAITGEHFFPLEGFKSGSVWSPGGGNYSADPIQTAFEKCQQEIPEKLVDLLRSLGITIE